MLKNHVAVVAAIVLMGMGSAHAAMIASDNASDVVYNDGWQAADNGGTGFTAWTFTKSNPNQGFFFTGKSGDNGDQTPSASNTDIDTPATINGRSWGIASGDGGNTSASRGFTGGALAVGQTFSINFDNGYIDGGSPVGVSLVSGLGSRYTVQFTGGSSNYAVNGTDTGLGFTLDGLNVSFTLTGNDTYSTTITRLAGGTPSTFTQSGTLLGSGDLTGFSFFVNNAGYGGANDQFINSVSVTGAAVPEPASLGLLGVAGLVALRRRRA